ncbi:MAG: phosphoribosyltransferase [Lachnospiraceae bacterium]|jgi:orotate phosphoribosyltransferase|nr:phosphoribosyltransferase [Lachnospiraceae bacterium]MEE3458115.1 phosphoribosyltransferase [Lachnospiraceae bacterium]
MNAYTKLESKNNSNLILRVVPGHFVTPNAHTNYYMEMTQILRRQSEAKAVAKAMSEYYTNSTIVDTILCLDGMDVIGAYLADELTRAGILSTNAHKTMYIISPEFDSSGQMFFRENMETWIRNKNILILLPTASTGSSITKAAQTVLYYGGKVSGVSAIFSAVNSIDGYPIFSLFKTSDLPDYHVYKHKDCPLCKAGVKVDAIVSGKGYSRIR